jgi:hypothetical protein
MGVWMFAIVAFVLVDEVGWRGLVEESGRGVKVLRGR